MGKYTVKSGDTLSEIAAANGTTVDELVRINGISDPDRIFAGQEIKLSDDSVGSDSGSSGGGGSGYEYKTSPFTTSEDTNAAWKAYNGITKPDAFDSDEAFKNAVATAKGDYDAHIKNGFKFDLNGDALYQQYKDKYIQQGKMAMQDTMGQAAALTGGYGNSYAATAGNQAYQAHLNNLNDIIPELQQMAYDRYNQEGQNLLNQYTMAQNDYNTAYGEWIDKMTQYNSEREYLYNVYNSLYNRDYNTHRDAITDEQWAAAMDYQTGRDKIADEQWQKLFDAQHGSTGGGSGGGSGSGSGGGSGSSVGSGGSSGGSGGTGGTGNTGGGGDTHATIPENVQNKAATYKNNDDLANYLDGLVASGTITEAQADSLYAQNKAPDQIALNKRNWTLVDDGGVNWFWGVDNNAIVKDQYGNKYRADNLVDKLVDSGMSKSDAKTYVKNLLKNLGA